MDKRYVAESLLDFVLAVITNYEFEHANTYMEFGEIMQTIQETKEEEKEYLRPEHKRMLQKVLDKLYKDGYIECKNPEAAYQNRFYTVTYEGGFAHRDMHYVKERRRQDEKEARLTALENNQKTNATNMTKLTAVLAIVGLLSIFIQSLEKFKIVFRIDFWVAIFLFVSGIMAGMIIYQLVMHLLEKYGTNKK